MRDKKSDNGHNSNMTGVFAVGCVAYLVTKAGHIWRELPGFDIGIDGEIEIPETLDKPASKIFVQVKGNTEPYKKVIRVDAARSHWKYWRTQRCPVLLCEVHVQPKKKVDDPYKALNVRWFDISRAPVDEPSSESSVKYKSECGLEFDFSDSSENIGAWRKFISDVVEAWPNRRIGGALDYADALIHAGKPKDALELLNGLEEPATEAVHRSLKDRLKARKLKAERHNLSLSALRATLAHKNWSCVNRYAQDMLLEVGYWHIVAASDTTAEVSDRVNLAKQASLYFAKLSDADPFDRLVKADFSLYAAMVTNMCENWEVENKNLWYGAKQLEHKKLEETIHHYHANGTEKSFKELQRISEANRTLWRSHLLSGDFDGALARLHLLTRDFAIFAWIFARKSLK